MTYVTDYYFCTTCGKWWERPPTQIPGMPMSCPGVHHNEAECDPPRAHYMDEDNDD